MSKPQMDIDPKFLNEQLKIAMDYRKKNNIPKEKVTYRCVRNNGHSYVLMVNDYGLCGYNGPMKEV